MTVATESALSVSELTMRFGGVVALDAFSMEVPQGSIFGLIGPNGAGKTTCFNCISGLYRPTAGSVRFGRADLTRLPRHGVARLGVSRTFQNVALYPSLTVRENVMVGAHARLPVSLLGSALRSPATRRAEAEIAQSADDALATLRLSSYAERGVSELPVGIQHRVEIARALVTRPKLLLLDEPAAGLTSGEVDVLRDVLLRLHAELKLTLVIVEHNMRFVMKTCTELAVLSFGRKLTQGTPEAVSRDPAVIEAYLGGAL
ncbi:MAG: ABC transporter ATP-binding protein [Comamonadaceae bacterium]|nr:MAG: ABC transporter ATP-binding protein [Comamonadaceae bacterium]